MKTAIRKHLRDFLAILGLVVVAAVVGGYILAHQRIYFPAWVPVVGRDEFILKGEFSTAQAVTPGQGQTVDIAGVEVGEISNVELADGRAVVTMRIQKRYADIYSNATMLLRPKTGLKDMVVELDPGSRDGGRRLEDGDTVPVSQTQPDVNLDEILAVLDRDTRAYLQLLLNGAAVGLDGNGEALAQAFREFDPLADDAREATRLLTVRRRHIQRSIANFGRLAQALGRNDEQLGRFVTESQAVLRRFANQGDNLEQVLVELPPTLRQTRTALEATGEFGEELGGALSALRPTARNLAPALRATRPFFSETAPVIRDEIRPFTRDAQPVVETLRPAARALAEATPDLRQGFGVFNRFLNALAYNPSGAREGYLFYLLWLGHVANSATAVQDAMGPMLRSQLLVRCGARTGLRALKGGDRIEQAALSVATQLSNVPDNSPYCPQTP